MARTSSQHVCQQCGYAQVGWAGKCPECGTWGSLVETMVSTAQSAKGKGQRLEKAKPVILGSIESKSLHRISTNISELDRVLGGGIVPGQVILIAGEPGIGKSTLLLQVADNIAGKSSHFAKASWDKQEVKGKSKSTTNHNSLITPLRSPSFEGQVDHCLYTSGEESAHQIKIRAERLGVASNNISLLEETDVDEIIGIVVSGKWKVNGEIQKNQTPNTVNRSLLIIDSIQTMSTTDLSGMAGSVGQVRECTYRLVRFAKSTNTPVIIVGHVTKEGAVAGPSVLMHLVDTVLWFEGDKTLTFRMLRARKNRFGPTDEVGIFTMQEKGLLSVDNPEGLFLGDAKENTAGSITSSILQGTRPVLVEIQALVVPTKMAFPRRVAQGIDAKRYELLLAVLTRRCGLSLNEYDCYANVSGGISLSKDPSADLAICLATASAYFDKQLPKKSVAIGEVGLLGDIRPVMAQEKRVKEAKRLGYNSTISTDTVKILKEAIRKYLI
jgi:DNA repair protein RadA/Sms